MNWTLLTTISLILLSPFNIGLASNNNTGTTQVQFDKVEVQAQTGEESVTVTQTLGPDGGSIIVDFMGQPRKVYFPPNALVKNTEITVKVTSTVAMSYPEDAVFLDIYRPDLLNYIGPQLIIELPSNALDWQNEDILKLLIEIDPGVNNGVDIKTLETTAEARTLLGNGDQYMDLRNYYVNDPVRLNVGYFKHPYMEAGAPTTTKVSVQIVDQSPLYGHDDESGNINDLNIPSSYFEEGVFNLTQVTLDFSNYCSGRNQHMPVSKIEGPINVPNEKIPLLLIHGWTVMEQFIQALPLVNRNIQLARFIPTYYCCIVLL